MQKINAKIRKYLTISIFDNNNNNLLAWLAATNGHKNETDVLRLRDVWLKTVPVLPCFHWSSLLLLSLQVLLIGKDNDDDDDGFLYIVVFKTKSKNQDVKFKQRGLNFRINKTIRVIKIENIYINQKTMKQCLIFKLFYHPHHSWNIT